MYRETGEYEEAQVSLERSIALYRQLDNKWKIAAGLHELAFTHEDAGHREEAAAYYEETQVFSRDNGLEDRYKLILINRADFYFRYGPREKGLALLEKRLAYIDQAGQGITAGGLIAVACFYASNSEFQKAVETYQKALKVTGDSENTWAHGEALNNLAGVYSALGQSDKALAAYGKALDIYAEHNNRENESAVRFNIGIVLSKTGDLDSALENMLRSRETRDELGLPKTQFFCHFADLYIRMGLYDEAEAYVQKDPECIYPAARMHLMQGDFAKAVNVLEEPLGSNQKMMSRDAYLDMHTAAGYAYLGLDQPGQALEHFQKAVSRIEWQLTRIPRPEWPHFVRARPFVFERHEAYQGIMEALNRLGRASEASDYCSSLETILNAPCARALPEWFGASR